MATQVTLGSFFKSGGKTILGGVGGSGLDTEGLLTALVDAKKLPATNLEDRIKVNDSRSTALGELRTLISKMKDAANYLRNPPGVANAADNLFNYRNSTVSSNTSVAGSTYMSVSVAPGTATGAYTLGNSGTNTPAIESIARAKKQSTGTFAIANADTQVAFASPGANQFGAGTITIENQKTGDIASIDITAGDTLNNVAAKFNAVKNTTGITASILQVGSNAFKLVFSANETGLEADFDLDDAGTVTADPSGVLSQLTFSDTQTASNARFTIDGNTIERQTNSISDVISGVTFNLLAATTNTTELTVDVTADTSIARDGVLNFVNAYNDLRVFYAKQSTLNDDGTVSSDSVLYNSSSMRRSAYDFGAEVAASVAGLNDNVLRQLGDIGVTFTDLPESKDNPFTRNILTVDEGKLSAALSSNFGQLRNIFEFSFSSSNPNVAIFSRSNALAASDISLNVVFAKAQVQETQTFTVADADTSIVEAVATPDRFTAGTATVNGALITLTAGDSLNTVAQKFNTVKSTTGIEAAVVEVAAGQFKLTFTSTATGAAAAFDLESAGTVTSDPDGVFGNIAFATTQAAVDSTYEATYVNASGGNTTINVDVTALGGGGYKISGQKGTALEGLVMVYGLSGDITSTIEISQGIADRMYNVADALINTTSGQLTQELEDIKTSNEKLQDDIDKINLQVEKFRETLLAKFSALEQAISKVNSLLQSLDAQAKAQENS